jgi:hypothetical protein
VKKMSMSERCSYVGMTAMFLAVLLFIPVQALAGSPLFSLDTYDDWLAAPISPVLENYDAASAHYGVLGEDYLYTPPEPLYVYEGDGSPETSDAGLVMAWGNSDVDLPQLAAWEYVYPEDPNLVGTKLNLTVMPPPGIWSVSLTLNDAAGGWVSWDWNVSTPGNPFDPAGLGPITPGVPYSITIDPTILAPQAGSTSFAVAGFNPAIATTIQADELAANPGGPAAPNWQQFPPVAIFPGGQPWNYWSQVSVTPEPVSSILFVAGGATLGLRRFWKKRKTT